MIAGRRYKFFCDLGDSEMVRIADLVNGFLKRTRADNFSKMLAPQE